MRARFHRYPQLYFQDQIFHCLGEMSLKLKPFSHVVRSGYFIHDIDTVRHDILAEGIGIGIRSKVTLLRNLESYTSFPLTSLVDNVVPPPLD